MGGQGFQPLSAVGLVTRPGGQAEGFGGGFAEAGDVPRFHPELGQHLAEFLDRGRVLQVVPDRVLRFLGVQQRERGTALRTGRVDPDLHVLGSLCRSQRFPTGTQHTITAPGGVRVETWP